MRHTVIIVCLMAFGFLLGVVLRKRERLINAADRVAGWVVYLLLFVLGIAIGSSEEIVGNLSRIGLQAAVISLAAMTGSALATAGVYVLWFRRPEREE